MNTNGSSEVWKQWVFKRAEKLIKTASVPLSMKELAWRAVKFAVSCGQSHPFSFLIRPLASYRHLRRVVGINLILLAIGTAIWGPFPSLASDTGGIPTLVVLPEGEANLITVETIKWPIPGRVISQKFWLLHAGIDIRTPEGTPVNPIMAGKIVEIEVGRLGYGLKVVINHQNAYKSLYAHLSKIAVSVGDTVTTDSIIGWSGNTGRSTGPHLHLEIHHNNSPVNPLVVLGNK